MTRHDDSSHFWFVRYCDSSMPTITCSSHCEPSDQARTRRNVHLSNPALAQPYAIRPGRGCPNLRMRAFLGFRTRSLLVHDRQMMIRPQLHLHRNRQTTDAFANLPRLRVREVQAHVASALMAVVGIKAVARDKRHVFRQCRPE